MLYILDGRFFQTVSNKHIHHRYEGVAVDFSELILLEIYARFLFYGCEDIFLAKKSKDQGMNPNWPVSSHFHRSFFPISSHCGGGAITMQGQCSNPAGALINSYIT